MALIDRLFGKQGDREPTPEWANFLGDSYLAFAATVRGDLDRRELAYTLDDDEGSVSLTGEESEGQKFGLSNLAQTCHEYPRRKWRSIVQNHFDGVFRIASTVDSELVKLGADFSTARKLLKVRLYPEDMAGMEFTAQRPIADGILAVLVYDLPDSVASVSTDHVSRWGVPEEELFEIGLANVKAESEMKPISLPGQDGAVVYGLIDDNNLFAATRALYLEDFLPTGLELGAIVAIPNRHAVLFHPIVDSKAVGALSSIIPAAVGMHQQGPGSVSPHVYWWQSGKLQRQPMEITDDGIHFNPTEEFIFQVLNRIRPPEG